MTPGEFTKLRELAERYVSDELTIVEWEALEHELQISEEARLSFLTYVEMHAGLAWEMRGVGVDLSGTAVAAGHSAAHRGQASWKGRLVLGAVCSAVILMLGLWAGTTWINRASLEEDPVYAVVQKTLHGRWANGLEVALSAPIKAGGWSLQSGLVELVTQSGTHLLVEGPASWEWLAAERVRLLSGSVVVRMEEGKSGFIVETPQMKVTDLGTEFGVGISQDGVARVQVYEGKVLTETADKNPAKELSAGHTLSYTRAGEEAPSDFNEERFIRRFPKKLHAEPGGALYNQSQLDTVKIAPVKQPVVMDGDLREWNRAGAFSSACQEPYASTYYLNGMMMYDEQYLYLSAHVGDPDPMRNAARENVEFAGGSVIVRVSTDRALGWPLKGSTSNARSYKGEKAPPLKDSLSDRIASIIMWHDKKTAEPKLIMSYGFNFDRKDQAQTGWKGAFKKDADGQGYTLEYAIPWEMLNCAGDFPKANDEMAALWMVHWSDAEGRICRGQLVDVTNKKDPLPGGIVPNIFFQHGFTWGRAVYLPKE